jgi:diguanylate cyclase (GGDEF)-like protein/PAS domain S-box-containing protein
MTADERYEYAEATLNSLADAVLSTDLAGRITYLNSTAEVLTGWSRHAAIGRQVDEIFSPVGAGEDCVLVGRGGRETQIEHASTQILSADGSSLGTVVVFRNAGAAREAARRLSHLAGHDALTDLPNRFLLNDRLTGAIALAERHKQPLAVLFLDVDGFKAVNDSLGHAAGDALLQSIASRLRAALRKSDTVSRYSGDEFVIVLPEIEQIEDAALVARKLVRAAAGPHRIDSRNVTVTASVGIAVYPDDGRNAETLIKHADTAMYDAKRTAVGSFRVFTPDLLPAPHLVPPSRGRTGATPIVAARRRPWPPRTFPLFDRLEDFQPGNNDRH